MKPIGKAGSPAQGDSQTLTGSADMKPRMVKVEMSQKQTVGCQSFSISVGLTAEIEDGEDRTAVVREIQEMLARSLCRMEGIDACLEQIGGVP